VKKYVVGNLKMNLTLDEINEYTKKMMNYDVPSKVIFCPTSIYSLIFRKYNFETGLQNVNDELKGAYTGEISVSQMKSLGIKYSIIGHSERRQHFKEDDSFINKKVKTMLENHLIPILCIGETKEEHDMHKTTQVLKRQVLDDLIGIDCDDLKNVIIAYEPVWAIGTNVVPSNKDINDSIMYIKKLVEQYFEYENITVLYGGSVNETNVVDILNNDIVDGVLVGGASINPDKFIKIIDKVRQI